MGLGGWQDSVELFFSCKIKCFQRKVHTKDKAKLMNFFFKLKDLHWEFGLKNNNQSFLNQIIRLVVPQGHVYH